MKRVVVTGVGVVSPLGCGKDVFWSSLINGTSGIRQLPSNDSYNKIPVSIAGLVPTGSAPGEFNHVSLYGRDVSKEIPKFALYAVHASDLALQDAKIGPHYQYNPDSIRSGVALATGIGAIEDIIEGAESLKSSYKRLRYPCSFPELLLTRS